MTSEVLNTWKEVAAFLKVSVTYAKDLARRHDDFPLFREKRIFTTVSALKEWIETKAKKNGET